ncbi:hypothetical protein OG756_03075 [Streptomyces sp. NBC_01310]|uniref:hypothetical protein n=1 Tax=Streptomyces sp. NBC_01310 TaxID=2903820 RepID=UPI0035B5CC47|nr:hypothetical protein OG756_03075 [Streptomyces sp. NBC_01310]
MDHSLLSLRAALALLPAALAGAVAGVLTAFAGEGTARSLLCGLAAAGLAVPFFDRLVAADSEGQTWSRLGAGKGNRRG